MTEESDQKPKCKAFSAFKMGVQTWCSIPCWNCLQMAARETGIGAVETFMHAGKLLALDLLVKVLQHQGHTWSHVRQEVCAYG